MFYDKNDVDISHVSSIKQVRHAMALNEERKSFPLLPYEIKESQKIQEGDGSVLQAWFVGAHADMGGGAG